MPRSLRPVLVALAALVVLFALHVQLNLGGWPHFVHRLAHGERARGELVAGFLPVT
jgi:hypothetical protein